MLKRLREENKTFSQVGMREKRKRVKEYLAMQLLNKQWSISGEWDNCVYHGVEEGDIEEFENILNSVLNMVGKAIDQRGLGMVDSLEFDD